MRYYNSAHSGSPTVRNFVLYYIKFLVICCWFRYYLRFSISIHEDAPKHTNLKKIELQQYKLISQGCKENNFLPKKHTFLHYLENQAKCYTFTIHLVAPQVQRVDKIQSVNHMLVFLLLYLILYTYISSIVQQRCDFPFSSLNNLTIMQIHICSIKKAKETVYYRKTKISKIWGCHFVCG